MWINREISTKIQAQARRKPAILLTGARQTGKSSLLAELFPDHKYVSLDSIRTAEDAETNPSGFLASLGSRAIIDEVQHAPSLFREIKTVIDAEGRTPGRFLLTGSQKFSLMKGAAESLAGRISIFELDTLSAA